MVGWELVQAHPLPMSLGRTGLTRMGKEGGWGGHRGWGGHQQTLPVISPSCLLKPGLAESSSGLTGTPDTGQRAKGMKGQPAQPTPLARESA